MIVKHGVFNPIENNCYLIIDEKTNQSALVDCSEFNQKMVDLIGDTDLKYILLTHGHFDHTEGVLQVKERYGCKVAINEADMNLYTSGGFSLTPFKKPVEKSAADITVSDGDVIHLGETEIKVIETPGHTKGSVCYIAGDCLFSGDTLFCCSCGRTDFPGGSVSEMRSSLEKLKNLEGDYKVMPGHEEFSTLSFERGNNPYMR